jgi:hypothetical protein
MERSPPALSTKHSTRKLSAPLVIAVELDDGHDGDVELDVAAVIVVDDVLVWLTTVVLDVIGVLAELIEDVDFVLAILALAFEALVDALPINLAPQTPL